MGAERDDEDAGAAVPGPSGATAPVPTRPVAGQPGHVPDDDRTLTPALTPATGSAFPDPSAGPLLVLYQRADGRLAARWRLDPRVLAGARAAFRPAARPTGELRLRRGAELLQTLPVTLDAPPQSGSSVASDGVECVVAGGTGGLHAELGLVADGGWMLVARSNRLDAVAPVGVGFLHGTGDAPAVTPRPDRTSARIGYGPPVPPGAARPPAVEPVVTGRAETAVPATAGRAPAVGHVAGPASPPAGPPTGPPVGPSAGPRVTQPPTAPATASAPPFAATTAGPVGVPFAGAGQASDAGRGSGPAAGLVHVADLAAPPDRAPRVAPAATLPGPFPLWQPGARRGAGAPLAVAPGLAAGPSLSGAALPQTPARKGLAKDPGADLGPDVRPDLGADVGPVLDPVLDIDPGIDPGALAGSAAGRVAGPGPGRGSGSGPEQGPSLATTGGRRRSEATAPPANLDAAAASTDGPADAPALATRGLALPPRTGHPAPAPETGPAAVAPLPGSGPVSSPREVGDPSLYAQLTVYGSAPPGSLLDLGGHAYRVGPGGRFVLALPVEDRDLILRLLGQLSNLPVAARDDDGAGGGAPG